MSARGDQVVDVWWAELRSVDTRLFALLDDIEAGRLGDIDRDADRGRFVLGATLLRVAVGAATGADPRSVRVERSCSECGGPHGAPSVDGVRVSVAHAGLLVLVGTADVGVGVDVERADRGDDVERWVVDEARFKVSADSSTPTTSLLLPTPLPRYRAAVAVTGRRAPEVVTHSTAESGTALELGSRSLRCDERQRGASKGGPGPWGVTSGP